ncbi:MULTISPECIES: N-acetyl-D-Glu racemase DgcA [unclassified Sphingomonas]|uniref:N-acetyl-D-Glu racemase DgcA n=1 Tax=unclassified Sphingomonas TaxID=196159 RepID=UPI00070112C3|nr:MULTISPECIES: N-acetyl-D-Glu racemase DgcA [unclassified Sphingomonas]KQX18529.1 mandelate racemase [Sphingomonas sp. Root1294]KQY72147.1 mandelate racemase [Sphingomonas sp. Root50]KRB94581.1 mandelate racemase [Sphingomonas sp. Root720]
MTPAGPRRLVARIETWPVAGSFVIARGAKSHVDVVVVEIAEGDHIGRGEATAIYYHGETAQSVAVQAEAMAGRIAEGANREELLHEMPRGAARNAIDAALWDLEARRTGRPAWALAGLAAPGPLQSAFTISLGEPGKMEADARAAAPIYPLLKLKLAGEGDIARVAAVRRGAPLARLIVDANEGWTGRDVAAEAEALLPYGVELIEQPVKAGEDHLLDGLTSPIPLCADESCQDRADLAGCGGRYAAINIKLDKAGGLTEALMLAAEARSMGLELMVGCMLSTSLGIAPAMLVAQQARWIDIDGPLLLAADRDHPVRFDRGTASPASPELWG